MKVIMVSRTFPAYHPKAGQPTYFVEKILNVTDKHNYYFVKCEKCGWMGSSNLCAGGGQIADTGDYEDCLCPKCFNSSLKDIDFLEEEYYLGKFQPKHHTIRAGKRFKDGDMASLRVWSGKPYRSKPIEIAQVEVKVWDFSLKIDSFGVFTRRGYDFPSAQITTSIFEIAKNDGLSLQDFDDWFPKPFQGQIICWNLKLEY